MKKSNKKTVEKKLRTIEISLTLSEKKSDALFDFLLENLQAQGLKYGKDFTLALKVEEVKS